MKSVQLVDVDVPVTELRAHLAEWITRVRDGEEVVVTDRGIPVIRLVPVDSAPILERLIEAGVIGRPRTTQRPLARDIQRVKARGSVSELVSKQRGD